MKKFLLAISILLMLTSPAWGATFYIDSSCGSSGDGTTPTCGAQGPFKTAAEIKWVGGNSYLFKGGVNVSTIGMNPHSSIITVGASGTAGNPITIGSYGTGQAILNGGITINTSSWVDNDPVAGVYSYTTPWGAQLLWEDSVPLKHASDKTCANGNWWADGATIFYKPTTGTISDHVVETYHLVGVDTNNHNYITIDGLTFTKLYYGVANKIPSQINASHIIVNNCRFTNSQRGIFLVNNNDVDGSIKISSSTFDYVGSSIMIGGFGVSANVDISYNTITHCSQVYGAIGYEWFDAMSVFTDIEGIGVQNLTHSNIYKNKITGICRGIYPYASGAKTSHDVNIYQNYISTARVGLLFLPSFLTTSYYNINAYYNVLENCGAIESMSRNSAVVISTINTPTGEWNNLSNNTIVGSPYGIFVIPRTGYTDMYWKIKNNIIYNTINKHVYEVPNATPTNIVYDYNLYYPDKADAFYTKIGSNETFAQWKAIDGYRDALSPKPANPLFVSATNFNLQSASPAIKAGANVSGVHDVVGISDYADQSVYNMSYPDIGAYTYIKTVSSPKNLRIDK